MNRAREKQQGFTLVEMLVAIVITGVISISLVQMLQVGQKSAERNRILVESQQNARIGLNAIAADLRQVSYGKDPTQPSIYYAGPCSVTFIGDIIPDHGGAEKVSYYLSRSGDPDTDNPTDTVLMRVVADTAGVPLISAPQAYGIAHGGLVFRWFNGQGVELANPVPQPEQIGEAFVSLTASSARQIGGTYPSLTLSETIYPRNLPLSPARSRPTAPAVGNLTFPDCQSATVSWTTPTTNTDGTPLTMADISYFGLYFGTDASHETLYTKLARTINQWTITGLDGGTTYYISVTCVSRSGVESYKATRQADMSSGNIPRAPATLTVSALSGGALQLSWSAVTQFTNSTTITTPVTYVIYRSTTAGFTPGSGNRVTTVPSGTTFTDSTMANCSTDYYQVRAKACGNESASSPEASGSTPAIPSNPASLTASTSATPGQINLSWTAPSTRIDGSVLSASAISGYHVLGDTIPNSVHLLGTISGAVTSGSISGLATCKTYYVNLQCVDTCNHGGQVSAANQTTVFTSAPCNAATPAAPTTCSATPANNQINLQWAANRTDCDLKGYKIYYGTTSGGPYNGTGAAQGNSPITVLAPNVTTGSTCSYALTSLASCQTYYVAVTSIDLCSPAHESAYSPQASGLTTCIACVTNTCCVAWAVDGTGYKNLHLEVYTTNSGGETITRLTPTYSGTAKVTQVWYGRPLTKIWDYNGSAGQDGATVPQPSGSVLNVTDFTVPSGSTSADGQPMELVFDSDVRDLAVTLTFRSYSGTCTGTGTGRAAGLVDDFDDGNYTGWNTVSSPAGTWSVTNGELNQTLTSSNYVLLSPSVNMGDLTYDAKIYVASGGSSHTAYLVFHYQNATNYYICGLNTSTDKLQLIKVQGGAALTPTGGSVSFASNDNTWYDLRVVVTGNRVRAYVNCNLVMDLTTTLAWATGGLGVSSRGTGARWDDVRMMAGSYLP